jgi:hypothetical protein
VEQVLAADMAEPPMSVSVADKRAMVERMEQTCAKPASKTAEITITVQENRRRLLNRHIHPTKTALAVKP